MKNKKNFFLECYELGFIKFGKFTLKSGIESPFYVDFRPLASKPKILNNIADHLLNMLSLENFNLICGVPYAAIPIATAMSLKSDLPLIIKRKEAKEYGTKKMIEGIYKKDQNCLLVEDVITSGRSLLETIPEIENEGIFVSDIIVILDREQGGKELLERKGYNVHVLFTISEIIMLLQEENLLTNDEVQLIKSFFAGNIVKFEEKKRPSYEQKLQHCNHSVAHKLLKIAIEKKSNLIASADVLTTAELLTLADKIGPNIVALKTHIDIITDFDSDTTILPLKNIATKHHFLLMEDRKFADIGNTQELQFSHGIYKISNWADFVTAQVIGGYESLDYFHNVGVVVILSMSSKGTLTDEHYFEKAQNIAVSHPNVIGGVSQKPVSKELLLFTPGVNLEIKDDGKGQQYNTPDHVFRNLKTDFMIVGRGIYKANDVEQASLQYKNVGWNAYLESLK